MEHIVSQLQSMASKVAMFDACENAPIMAALDFFSKNEHADITLGQRFVSSFPTTKWELLSAVKG